MSCTYLLHRWCRVLGLVSGCFLGLSHGGPVAGDPHEPCNAGKAAGLHANLKVYERLGLQGIEFNSTREQVEAVLGPPEGGSEHYITYDSSGIQVCFCGDRVKDIHFEAAFRGKLFESGLGIGNDLDEVIAAYGELKEEKVVDSVCGWMLDRVLLVHADPVPADEPAYKLSYYDQGLFFLFDDGLIIEFGAYKPCSK